MKAGITTLTEGIGGAAAGFVRDAAPPPRMVGGSSLWPVRYRIAPGITLIGARLFVIDMRTSSRHRPVPADDSFEPLKVVELEISEPIGQLAGSAGAGRSPDYRRARVLVRLHGCPLGWLELDLSRGPVSSAAIRSAVERELGATVEAHLAADGLDPSQLAGQPSSGCAARREVEDEVPLATVVVCTIDRPEADLDSCLASLGATDYPLFEVLVVDNSPDRPRTAEIVAARSAVDPRVRMVREPRTGLSHARNAGLTFARGDIVAFTDDDARVDPGWLSAIVAEFTSDARIACVTGPVATAEIETADQAWFDAFGGFDKGYQRRVFDLADNRDPSPAYPYQLGLFGTGANMAFRRSMLPDEWRFDVALGAGSVTQGGEDQDAFLDVLFRGHRLVYNPLALVWHRHRSDHDGLRRQMYQFGTGVGAVITKRLLGDGSHRGELVRVVPAGVRHLFRPGSRTATGSDYPPDLRRAELAGLAASPFVYLRSRLKVAWSTA